MTASSQIRLFTGFECNNACRFCEQGAMKDSKSQIPSPSEVLGRISGDLSLVQFTGGESTLDADRLLEAVEKALEKKVNEIRLQTNGRMLAYGNLIERLLNAGLTGVDVSLQGAKSLSHDWITQAPGSFKQSVAGIRKAVQAGLDVSVTMVIIKSNFREAPNVAKLCAKLGVSSLHFRMVESEGWAAEEAAFPALTPKYSLVLPYLTRAAMRAEKAGLEVHLHNFPNCQAGSLRSRLRTESPVWAGLPEKSWDRAERIHPDLCQTCSEKDTCIGLTVAYNDYYGSGDLVPFESSFEAKKKRA